MDDVEMNTPLRSGPGALSHGNRAQDVLSNPSNFQKFDGLKAPTLTEFKRRYANLGEANGWTPQQFAEKLKWFTTGGPFRRLEKLRLSARSPSK